MNGAGINLQIDSHALSHRLTSSSISKAPTELSEQGVKVTLPRNLLSNLKTPLTTDDDIDAMLIAWNPDANPVPNPSNNPVIGIELRAGRSENTLPLTFPMASAVRLQLPIFQNISKVVDPRSGLVVPFKDPFVYNGLSSCVSCAKMESC